MLSSHDMLALVAELVTRRTSAVLGADAKRKLLPLPAYLDKLPAPIKKGMLRLRHLHDRYSKGKYEHDDKDVGHCESICNYLIEIHQEAGKHPVRPVQISAAGMQASAPVSDGKWPDGRPRPRGSAYREMIGAVREMG